jgi:peptidylprolyl isomerase domain and WD repeat-containing protein 1
LFEFAKFKAQPVSPHLSPQGTQFVCMAPDRVVRVFHFATGKLRRSYDETLDVIATSVRAAVNARFGNVASTVPGTNTSAD